MKAFLKRRWILISCAGVLASLGFVYFSYTHFLHMWCRCFGIGNGFIVWYQWPTYQQKAPPAFSFAFDSPKFGTLPSASFAGRQIVINIPIWLPLATVLGWIVFRELRWREKRAKECSSASDP